MSDDRPTIRACSRPDCALPIGHSERAHHDEQEREIDSVVMLLRGLDEQEYRAALRPSRVPRVPAGVWGE